MEMCHSPDLMQSCGCMQVAYLEQLVAQNTGGLKYMQAPTLHTGLPAVPLPSPQTDPTLKCTPPGESPLVVDAEQKGITHLVGPQCV